MRTNALAKHALLAVAAVLVALVALPAVALAATPSRVTGVKVVATADPAKASVRWSAAKYATSYVVYRSLYGVGSWTKVASGRSRSFTVPTGADERYSYRVRAYSSKYRKYGAYSTLVTPQPADLADLAGDAATGAMSWSASEGAARYLISVSIGDDEPLVRATADTTASFATLVPLFTTPGVVFEVTPVSAAGVQGLSLVWEAASGSQDGGTDTVAGDGSVVSHAAGAVPGTFIAVLRDSITSQTYTVLVDSESLLTSDLNGDLTADAFFAEIDSSPQALVNWELVTSPKTEGTTAQYYLSAASIAAPDIIN